MPADTVKTSSGSKTKRRTARPGEVYAYYIEALGKYGACQVIDVNQNSILQTALDYLEPEPPAREQIEGLSLYHRQSYRMHHHIVKSWIENHPVPQDYQFIGTCTLKTDPVCASFSGRWPAGEEYCYEERWKAYDADARAAYKKYINSQDSVCVHGQTFRKNTGGLTDALYECLSDTDTLEDFPCITFAQVSGWSRKLERCLLSAPLLATLRLKRAGADTLDLSKTHLDHLELDMAGIRTLILPPAVRSLVMYGAIEPSLCIDDHLCSGKIDLSLSLKKAAPLRYGLLHVCIRRLFLKDISELDMEQVTGQFPETENLHLTGSPGKITRMQKIRHLHSLRCLCCTDLFGYGASDLEGLKQLSKLRELDFESIPKEAGTYLKKCWKGRLDRLSVTRLRTEDWLADNLDNPLRHWDGSDFVPPAAYQSAFRCYKDTKKKLLAASGKEEILKIVRRYTLHFNRLNDRYEDFIETEEREDIFLAMQYLYETCILHGDCKEAEKPRAVLTPEELWNAMDEVRGDW